MSSKFDHHESPVILEGDDANGWNVFFAVKDLKVKIGTLLQWAEPWKHVPAIGSYVNRDGLPVLTLKYRTTDEVLARLLQVHFEAVNGAGRVEQVLGMWSNLSRTATFQESNRRISDWSRLEREGWPVRKPLEGRE